MTQPLRLSAVLVVIAAVALGGCGGGGEECVPNTCARAARVCGAIGDGCGGRLECGTISDGCGHRLPCGDCAGAAICAAAGTANTCEQPADPCTPGAWTNFGSRFFTTTCVGCHAPFAQLSVVRAERKLRDVIASDQMPGNRKLTPGEKSWVLQWIDCGKKE